MMRRSLFFGLTLILILAFTFLSVRGCQQEKEPDRQPTETVEKSEATATRVLQPQDLEIVQSKMVLDKNTGAAGPSFVARHEIEIFNRGNVPYKNILLRFEYLSRTAKVMQTKDYSVAQSILPGATLKLGDIRMDGISGSESKARVSILYAEIGNSTLPAAPRN